MNFAHLYLWPIFQIAFTLILAAPSLTFSQGSESQAYHIERIEVRLSGSTNVNKFECQLDVEPGKDMSVEVTQKDDGFVFTGVVFKLPAAEFTCGQKLMTREMHQLLKVDQFPEIILEVKNFKEFNPTQEGDFKVSSDVLVTICDQKRDEVFTNGYWRVRGKSRFLGGYHEIQLTDYALEPPKKMLGTVVTNNTIGLEFEIKLRRDK